MAEEAEVAEGKGGGGLVKILIMVIPALLIGLGGGYFLGSSMTQTTMEEQALKEPTGEGVESSAEEGVGPVHKLDPFVVNLNDQKGNRYLKCTVQLELSPGEEDLKGELEARQAQLQDLILSLLTSKTTPELQSLDGKMRLRHQLLSRINQTLRTGSVKRVFFTEFVIQ
ncbi:MAG: flagellar basal body-associated FliL family protein [Magnetococcus sp. WYHC-3]